MRSIIKATAAVTLAAGLALASLATPALADDIVAEPATIEVVEASVPAAPIEPELIEAKTKPEPSKHDPVTICHNGGTITVDDSALAGHLGHGDTVGDCPVVVTPPVEVDTKATLTLRWLLPDGGTASNVTWPQTPFDPNAPVECDTTVTIQVDTYPYGTAAQRARTDALDDDGVLTYGEDHHFVRSWYFETKTGPECVVVPEQPADIVAETSSESTDCDTDVVTTTRTVTTTGTVYDEATNAWVPTAPVSVETVTTRDATELECPPVVVPPTEPPVVVPPVVEPPTVVTPPATVTLATPTAKTAPPAALAFTGTDDAGLALGGFVGVLTLLAGIAALAASRVAARK